MRPAKRQRTSAPSSKKRRHTRTTKKFNYLRERKQIGYTKNVSSSKSEFFTYASTLPTFAQTSIDITNIDRGDGINNREQNSIYISGFQLNFYYQNTRNYPVGVNVAIVCPKNSSGISSTGWYRSYGSSRIRNFLDATNTGQDNYMLPINNDEYNILYHKRFKVNEENDTGLWNSHSGKNWGGFKKFVKLNRQVTYETNVGTSANEKIYLVFWCNEWIAPAPQSSAAGAMNIQIHLATFFRDPK